jgi:hypothetical protein
MPGKGLGRAKERKRDGQSERETSDRPRKKGWTERSIQKQRIRLRQKERAERVRPSSDKGRKEALKRARTIRERVAQSRTRNRDLWSHGL